MKKIYRKEEGVSPVIATILMVAITVVLAATVYIMVAGIGGPSAGPVTGKIAAKEKIKNNEWKLTFSDFNPDTNITSLKVVVTNGSATDTISSWTWSSSTKASSGKLTNTKVTVEYHDLAGNNIINTGDYLLIIGTQSGATYGITLLDSHGNQITSTSFTA